MLNEAIMERSNSSSETLGLREGLCAAAMMPRYDDKFPNVDKSLGPEMKSTGEAIYYQGLEGSVLPAGVWGAEYVLE